MTEKIIFLSHFLNEKTPSYGGSSGFKIEHSSKIIDGASSNSQLWTLSNHIGTHIDLPAHFDDRGKRLNGFQASDWIFNSPFLIVKNVNPGQIIEVDETFENIPMDSDFIIIKTNFQNVRNEKIFWENNPGLSPQLASWIRVNRPNVKALGFDFISITSYSNRPLGRISHKAFLGIDDKTKPLRVIEDMKLDELKTHPVKIIVAPILVDGADGAPVTVIAFI